MAASPLPRGRLFRKYAGYFVALVCAALLTSGASALYFAYQESRAGLLALQREKAAAAAYRIERFISEIEHQVGWTYLPQGAPTSSPEQLRFEYLKLLRQVPAITEATRVDENGREQLRVSRFAPDVVGSGADLSSHPGFVVARAGETYHGPVYFRRETEPYMTVALAGEIYDHFGEGESSPESLRRFVDYAVTHWTPPAPRYLLLVGAGRYDYRDYLGLLPENHVPSMMVPVTHSGETVSDSRLADLNDDGRPELAVGRWPLDDPEAVSRLVERTLAYENGQASDRVLFSADGSSTEFTSLSDRLVEASGVPAGNIEKLYGVPLESMTRSWNDGSWLISYVGHGSINLWGKDSLFNQEGIDGLRLNGSYAPPIVAQFTCLTGFYAHPKERSLSENQLTSDSGPVLIIGATSLTLSSSQRPFAEKILLNLQDPRFTRIGDAFLDAKTTLDLTDLGVQEVVDTFGLLGDPTALIIRPAP